MKLSKQTSHGIKIMVHLADAKKSNKSLSISELSSLTGVTNKFLEKIVSNLKKSGLIISERGKDGGYTLNKSSEKITIGDIVKVLESSTNISDCNSGCGVNNCPNRDIFMSLQNRIDSFFDSLTLSSIVNSYNKKQIYLDSAATTNVRPEVVTAMLPYFTEIYGNSNSLHGAGREALKGVNYAREMISKLINATPGEIYFTSGGTEANNWALRGVSEARVKKGKHILVSSIEHHSVLDSAKYLKLSGYDVEFLKVNEDGFIEPSEIESKMRKDTILVSVMMVNNETGAIQRIKEIGEICKKHDVYFHVDAVQALSTQKIDVNDLNIDLLSISSHKIHGPKGVGALYIRDKVLCSKFMIGGEQEKNRRGGTTNVPAVVGFGKAAEILLNNREADAKKINSVSSYFIEKVKENIDEIVVNSPSENRAPTIANISFKYIEGESIMLLLDFDGICVSTGSACASGSLQKSHVLKAMGRNSELINGAVRFSFDDRVTSSDVDFVVLKLKDVVARLRSMSPLYRK